MSNEFENALIAEFSQLDHDNFNVNLSIHHIFLCGGTVDATADIPPSFRDRLITYTANTEHQIHNEFVLAENFKDYFKDNTYTDLQVFEDEIANISSLVIIFLESPGSLVELGMFCSKPGFYKKLLIVVPEKEIHEEDSFIYLGPLEFIRKKDPSSVAIYPWPDPDLKHYDVENIGNLCEDIRNKLAAIPKGEKFKSDNSGHLALLVCEIVTLCYPILIGEIELTLFAMDIDIPKKTVYRYLYLLNKLDLIGQIFYSKYRYYYPSIKNQRKIKFGKTKTSLLVDRQKIRMSIMQSFVLSDDEQSKKRKYAQKQILEKLSGGGE